jgi:uncharacterized protein
MAQVNIAFAFSGFLVGALVGLTGVGGGSLMTPILIVIFGVHPLSAVGTDLLFAAITKSAGARIHAYRGNVDWPVVGLMSLGSVPAALGTIFMMARLPAHSPALAHAVTVAIGVALLFAAAGLLFGQTVDRFATKIAGKRRDGSKATRSGLTVFLGFLLGVLVSLTSIGAGAVGMVILRLLYAHLPTVRLVGSDVAHAVSLTLLAGSGHWLIGDVQWALLGSLLIGSIPGIILASHFAHQISDGILRRVLGLVLLVVAAPILMS